MRNNYKKIVIINTVPINGGDEALLIATTAGLRINFNNPSITVLCNNPILTQKFIVNEDFDWDWEYAYKGLDKSENILIFSVKLKIREVLKKIFNISYHSSLSRFLASGREKRVYEILSDSDLVLLGAGGYIHDFYGYEKRLKTLEFIRDVLKKPYYFFSQSIGPFWNEEHYNHLRIAFNGAKKIILREDYSLNHLKSIGFHCDNVVVSNDIAFNLYSKHAKEVNLKRSLKKVAINFREWEFEIESKDNLVKARMLCENLIKKGYELTFVSTCQGVIGYRDDSKFAKKIVDLLNEKDKKNCVILNEKYAIKDFLEILSSQDAYIGMRLHGAILSLIAGIPALNIAYEDKTLGVYKSLGLTDYCFSYKENVDTWIDKVDNFIKDYSAYLNKVEEIRKEAYGNVQNNFIQLLT